MLIKVKEDTTSSEGTQSIYVFQFWKTSFNVLKREDTTSCPLDNSVNCSETNVVVMQRDTSANIFLLEAFASIA